MSGLALFKRKNQSQALVQAPSMDLIVSDTGPRIPEPVEITCRITAEEFESYMKSVNYLKDINPLVNEEGLRQALKALGYKCYPNEKVNEFLDQQAKNLSYSKILGKGKLYARYHQSSDYANFLPPKIINKVQEIKNHPYCPSRLYYWVSDLFREDSGFIGKGRHDTEICFLALFHLNLSEYKAGETALIIDAWRGPTFSDEEAKI